ncbi:MAG TPA: tRNA pseudouridine(55) synthase TruB [Bacteroidales bacterium]|nr:MAG: tRNA pseudouridine(55) synthase TruB [Bacteroidetes bacterium GWE2_42_24]OFY30442.1 MAG: tRNA pseudouridine(55) synthase TruB [Bacteroidetes bacterium GWF2_43_11]HAQ65907.1 tRNA pseudouridine(55) synthase TruB [Bacteroidales bacterium]HBZ65310.1 tRNA pseudouridine(55) synthase TruB [Bacteroidales bacterium]
MTNYNFAEGEILLFDKPYRWTSFDVVGKVRNYIRRYLGVKSIKVGHAGTLDPLATGLLIVCTGKATKQIDNLQASDKEYAGTFVLGATTPSFDLEKEVDVRWPDAHITEFMIRQSAAAMTGPQMQIPPVFSAVKVDGKRAYDYARDNQEVIIAPKPIVITEFEITRVAMPEVGFRIVCSKGTYIRAIARDFGLALGSGAYMSELRRTRSGEFRVTDAFDPETFCQQLKEITPDRLGKAI